MIRPAALVVMAVVAAVLAYALWYSRAHPRKIIATGTVEIKSERPPFRTITLPTRDVEINAVRFREVQLPGGTWIDCAGECSKAVRNAREDFWDTVVKDRR